MTDTQPDFYEMINGEVKMPEALAYLRVVCEAIQTGDPAYDVWGPYAGAEHHERIREARLFEPENWGKGERGDLLIGSASNTEELARAYGHFHPARANAAFIMLARTWLPRLVDAAIAEATASTAP